MLASLLDGISQAPCSYRFASCSMKSIWHNKAALWQACMVSMRGATGVSLNVHRPCQATLQASTNLIADKQKHILCRSFPSQTIQSPNIPLQRTRTEIWANNPPPTIPMAHDSLFPTFLSLLFFSFVCIQNPQKLLARLHARTPYPHIWTYVQSKNTRWQTTQYILQKNVRGA